jgi:hypothetical protein
MVRLNRHREETALDSKWKTNNDDYGQDRPTRGKDDDRPVMKNDTEQGVEVEYDVDKIIVQGTGEEEEKDANGNNDDMGVEVEYDVNEIMMWETEKEENTNDNDNQVGGKEEYDIDEIMMREGGEEIVVPPPRMGDGAVCFERGVQGEAQQGRRCAISTPDLWWV